MKVELIEYTGKPDTNRALDLLLTTKGTRLAHGEDPATWSAEKKAEHLAYMRDTIKSSWEFVDYVFRVSGVTRAFTHQLVRTRPDSYAQEAMRVIDAREHEVVKPESITAPDRGANVSELWDDALDVVMGSYGRLIDAGVPPQDARGLLPTNITTSIIVKKNLRSLANTAELRLCTRTQGEYQNVFREMKRLVCEVHPWADEFINVFCVNHGHCAFPKYGEKECPIYPAVMPNAEFNRLREDIRRAYDTAGRYEASPIARDGKAV